MSIKLHNGDIFTAPINILVHQANCFHTMGGGIAKVIKERFPEVYAADCKTKYGDSTKMGSYSFSNITNKDYPQIKTVINLYSQFHYNTAGRNTSYDSLYDGLSLLSSYLRETDVIGIPHGLGCGLGGGSWPVVEAIIRDIFEASPHKVLICKL